MKSLVVCAVTAATLVFASVAAAGGYKGHGHHGYGHHGYKHHGFKHHGHHHHRRYRSHQSAYLLGGLVLGSALTYAFTRPHYYSPRDYYYPHRRHYGRYYSYPRRHVVHETRVIERPSYVVSGRHLHRDLEGHCFEIRRNEFGDELRTQLSTSQCDW